MQRPIKFRAWDKQLKEMVTDEQIQTLDLRASGEWTIYSGGGLKAVIRDPFQCALFIHRECILMQYTGLKDKNGKEIYEGDILQMAGKVRQPRWEVAWYENGWQMKLVWIKGRLPEHYYVKLSSDKVVEFDEIIGNIYENPELLEHGQGAGSSHSDSNIKKKVSEVD